MQKPRQKTPRLLKALLWMWGLSTILMFLVSTNSSRHNAGMQQVHSDRAYKDAYAARDAYDRGDMAAYRNHAESARAHVDLSEGFGR